MSQQKMKEERGSMFLVALIALSVVTLIGLSLAMITETEMILGSNEWMVTETHFAAEAGVNVQMAMLLNQDDTSPVNFVLPSYFGRQDTRNQIGFEVKSSGNNTVERATLPYSKANFGDASGFDYAYFYALIRARRVGWNQGRDVPNCNDTENAVMAQKYISTSVYSAPHQKSVSAGTLLDAESSAQNATYSEDFFCSWEVDENKDAALIDVESTNTDGSAHDILTRGNPFYFGYSGS